MLQILDRNKVYNKSSNNVIYQRVIHDSERYISITGRLLKYKEKLYTHTLTVNTASNSSVQIIFDFFVLLCGLWTNKTLRRFYCLIHFFLYRYLTLSHIIAYSLYFLSFFYLEKHNTVIQLIQFNKVGLGVRHIAIIISLYWPQISRSVCVWEQWWWIYWLITLHRHTAGFRWI